MDFAATVDALLIHAKTAGKGLSNPITDVAFGSPTPTGERCIRIYYTGEADPSERMGGKRVLNGEMVAERLVIVGFWAMSNLNLKQAAVVESEVRALKHAIKTRVFADAQLGGQSTDLSLGYAEVDWGVSNNTLYRTLEIEVLTDFEEYPLAQ